MFAVYCSRVVWITEMIIPGIPVVVMWQKILLLEFQPWRFLNFLLVVLKQFCNFYNCISKLRKVFSLGISGSFTWWFMYNFKITIKLLKIVVTVVIKSSSWGWKKKLSYAQQVYHVKSKFQERTKIPVQWESGNHDFNSWKFFHRMY